jgi:HK97 family phage major capsid protein
MSMKQTLKEKAAELQKHQNEFKGLWEQLEGKRAKKETVTPEELAKLDNMEAAGKAMRTEVERIKGILETDELLDAASNERQAKDSGRPEQRQSKGAQFINSETFKEAVKSGAPTTVPSVEVKDMYSAGTAGGALIARDRQPEVITLQRQPVGGIRLLVNRQETNSNLVEFIKQSVRTNNAAPTADRNAGNTDMATKPQSDLQFTNETAPVRTIPHWMRAHRNLLMDAPRLRDTIDTELEFMGDVIEETQIVRGDGAGENLRGIINSTGIQLREHKVSGRAFSVNDKIGDTIRKAITDVQLAFFLDNITVALSPQVAEALELEKDGQGRYLNVLDPVRLTVWRKPVVESFALTAEEAIVGNFLMAATLWDRMQSEIRVSENVGEDFIKNAIRILEERRLAFAVTRGNALEYINGLDG